jgi:hypothetical protein
MAQAMSGAGPSHYYFVLLRPLTASPWQGFSIWQGNNGAMLEAARAA